MPLSDQEMRRLGAYDEIIEAAMEQEERRCKRMIGPYPCCTVVQGDCLELMKAIPDGAVDAVITDPPYEFVASGGGLGAKRGYEKHYGALTNGFDVAMFSRFPNWMAFCSKNQLLKLMTAAEKSAGRWMLLTWNKPDPTPLCNGNYLPDTEYIVHRFDKLYGGYDERARFTVMIGGTREFHPTAKPLALMERLVRVASDVEQIILDPFCGSGTTLVAAKKLGRHFLGFEISPEYCEIARRRLAEIDAQPSLFEPKPEQMTLEA